MVLGATLIPIFFIISAIFYKDIFRFIDGNVAYQLSTNETIISGDDDFTIDKNECEKTENEKHKNFFCRCDWNFAQSRTVFR